MGEYYDHVAKIKALEDRVERLETIIVRMLQINIGDDLPYAVHEIQESVKEIQKSDN